MCPPSAQRLEDPHPSCRRLWSPEGGAPSSPPHWIQESEEQLALPTRALPPVPCPPGAVPIPCPDRGRLRVAEGVLSLLPKSSLRPLSCRLSSLALSLVCALYPSPHPKHVAQVTLHLG